MIKYILNYCKKRRKGIYVLKLSNEKYYIGESNDIDKRIIYHKTNKGSKWTTINTVVEELKPNIKYQNNFWELTETLYLMEKHGIDNVRGSMFTNINLSTSDKIIAAQLYCELNNLCRKCGREGHFINDCKEITKADWVNKFGGKLNNRSCIECNTNIENLPSYFRYCRPCYSISLKN